MKALMLIAALATTAHAAPKKIAIVVYEGVEIRDFAGPAEVLAAGSKFAGVKNEIYLVAKSTAPIKSQGFITITPDYAIDRAPKPDIVVIPGGASSKLEEPAMLTWLLQPTEVTLTVCTGVVPIAKAGVLDGKDITTYYGAIEHLQQMAPKVRVQHGRRFIDNGRFITTAGVSAGIDGALHLVARLYGRRVADQTARYMEYHWTPEPYLATNYAYWNPSTDERGRALQMAQLAVEEKRWPEAIAAYTKLAAADKTGETWLSLGNALFFGGKRAQSIDAYLKVPSGSPSYATAVYNLACAYALEGKKPQAIAAIKKAFAAGIPRSQALADADLRAIHADIAALNAPST